nr:unnamed protein product [Callosobruchus analis]
MINSVNKRNRLHSEYKNNPNNEEKKSEYLYYKNKLDKLIKQAKHNYYHKQINENNNNAKNLWKVVNNICSKENDVISKTIVTANNKVCDTPNSIADSFNDFFCGVGKMYAEKIEKPNTHPLPRSINQSSFFLEPTSEIEINKTISSLKNEKSTGFDNLKTEMLKNVSDSVAKHLNHLINTIFITGKVPYQFKIAVVTPVHKKGDKKDINNYRPISVISVLAKVFEKF